MKIHKEKDCKKAAKLIGVDDITALTIAEAFGLLESEEGSKRKALRLKLETTTSHTELFEILNEAPKGSEIEFETLKKLLENACTQEERWAILPEATIGSEIRLKIIRALIAHATSHDELLKIHRENSLSELGEEALRKLCEIL